MTVSSPSPESTISIRLSTDGFCFSVLDPTSEDSTSFVDLPVDDERSLTANLRQAFRQTELLRQAYRRANVLVAGSRWTLLPLEMFDDDQAEQVLYYTHPASDHEVVGYNILKRLDAVVVYAVDRAVYDFVRQQWPEVRIYAQSTPLLEHFAYRSRMGNSRKLYAFVHGEYLNVYALDRGRLLLGNSMACRVTADRVYYLMYLWRQLGLDQARDELHLSGLLPQKEALVQELRRYVRQVFVANPASYLDLQVLETME